MDCIEVAKAKGEGAVNRIPIEVQGALPGQETKQASILLNRSSQTAYLEVADLAGL